VESNLVGAGRPSGVGLGFLAFADGRREVERRRSPPRIRPSLVVAAAAARRRAFSIVRHGPSIDRRV